jgi:hypothetical protein
VRSGAFIHRGYDENGGFSIVSDHPTKTAAEPPLSYRLFAKRAAIVADIGARWASSALESGGCLLEPVPQEVAARFAGEVQRLLDIILRDSKSV